MPLNEAFLGRVFPPSAPYQVGREKIREFASAIGDANPAFHDVEAARALGYPDVIAPPTFAVVLALKASTAAVKDPELGLDYSRVVHGEQTFAYSRPIVAGDELVVTVTIDSLRTIAGNDMVNARGDITTVDGEHVATTTSLLVARALEPSE
ncbi:MAG: MaoC family dehydratase [Actinomycetales bacterium]|nr:MaoC family dehydratase [Actinomycetales bacterium]